MCTHLSIFHLSLSYRLAVSHTDSLGCVSGHVVQGARHNNLRYMRDLWNICGTKGSYMVQYVLNVLATYCRVCVCSFISTFMHAYTQSNERRMFNIENSFNFFPSFNTHISLQQLHINDIKHLLQNVASGKAPSLSTNWWPNEATRRLIVLCLSTLGLLFARLNIMGAQLPVFTK